MPGKWLLYVDAERLNELVRPSDLNCAAHTFPLDFRSGFLASVRETLPNVFERIETVNSPVGAERLRSMGARGIIIVRGESLNSRLRVVPGFWSNNISTDVDIAVGVQVEGPTGRLFGKTVDGRGRGDTPAGAFCSGGAQSLAQAGEQAQREALRRLAEDVGNSDRVRAAR